MKKDAKYTNHNEFGINKLTFDLLFSDKEEIRDINSKEKIRDYILYIIDTYTKFREKGIFTSLLKTYFGAKAKFDFSKIVWNEEKKEYEFDYLGEKYTFNKISNLTMDKKAKKELESEKRYGQCHMASIGMAVGQENDTVLTGYVNIYGGKYLHSVIETSDGKIIDWTKNLYMPKEEYIRLTGFSVIESIKSDELLEMISKFTKSNIVDSKVLSVFGKELIKDIKKNPSIFKDDEDLRRDILEAREENKKQREERD